MRKYRDPGTPLSDDALRYVFQYLNFVDRRAASLTCKRWYEIINRRPPPPRRKSLPECRKCLGWSIAILFIITAATSSLYSITVPFIQQWKAADCLLISQSPSNKSYTECDTINGHRECDTYQSRYISLRFMVMVENDTGNFQWTTTLDTPFSYEKRYYNGDVYGCYYNIHNESEVMFAADAGAAHFAFSVPILFGFFLILVVVICIVMELLRCPSVTLPLCDVEYVVTTSSDS